MARKQQGLFITFEGVDGAGKSTLIREMARQLKKKRKRVLVTREPGGGKLSESIRRTILKFQMQAVTELLLYEASRSEHVETVIRPALKEGRVVLCDRYTDSSLAYQAHARGLPWKLVQKLNKIATGELRPHRVIFLDTDPTKALKRAKKTRFEKEGLAFQKKVRSGFLKAMREQPRRWIRVRAKKDEVPQVAQKIIERLGL